MKSNYYVSSPKDIPQEQHWAILTPNNTYVPGDERSRTNPGHGYPAHTVQALSYIAFTNEEEWENEVRVFEKRGTPYSAIRVTPAVVSKEIKIT